MKRSIFLSFVSLVFAVSTMAADNLVVSDVTVAQGQEAVLDIGCEMQTACKAFQMDVELGSGFTLKLDASGKPEAELGTTTDHNVYSRRVSDGKYRFVVISMNGQQLPTSGSLLKLTVVAPSTAQAGSSATCIVKAIEFATAQTERLLLSNATFKVTIATPPPKGDTNGDNTVDVADIATIIDVMAGVGADPVSARTSDVNEDGTVDVADIATVIDIMAGGGTNDPYPDPEPSYTSCPDDNHPHAIDLGLPSGTKWACCNVDASTPEQYGGYYAWGEKETKNVYSWETYDYYSNDDANHLDIGTDIAGTIYDVATEKWGTVWSIPSVEQCREFVNNTTSEWVSQNNVFGRKFVGSNGGYVFIPAAGRYIDDKLKSSGDYGYYWSSTLGDNGLENARVLNFNSEEIHIYRNAYRYHGRTVRPVRTK